jgi:hypothetical protein
LKDLTKVHLAGGIQGAQGESECDTESCKSCRRTRRILPKETLLGGYSVLKVTVCYTESGRKTRRILPKYTLLEGYKVPKG